MPKKLTITISTFYKSGNVTNLPISRIFRKIGVMRLVSSRFPLLVFTILAFAWISPTAHAGTCCVWRVTSVPQPFYLVGTIHALTGTDYPLPKPYDQALRDSKQLIFEMDPHPNAEDDFAKKFDVAAAYPKGDNIRRHVHGKTYVFLHKNFGYSGLLGPKHGLSSSDM